MIRKMDHLHHYLLLHGCLQVQDGAPNPHSALKCGFWRHATRPLHACSDTLFAPSSRADSSYNLFRKSLARTGTPYSMPRKQSDKNLPFKLILQTHLSMRLLIKKALEMCNAEEAGKGWQDARHRCLSNAAQTEAFQIARTSALEGCH